MARTYVGFNADTTEAAALAGFLKGLSMEIKTDRHMGSVLKMTHALMSEEFTEHMSVLAGSQQSRFHHVYEWGMVGLPQGKLWTDKLIGGGNNRVATFQWRASKKTVPVREDFKAAGVKQIHVFVWKAPVMETGADITIAPKRGRFLAYFTGPTTPENKYPMKVTDSPIQVQNPGGTATKGAFTKEYVGWWGGTPGEAAFNRRVRMVLENDLGRMPIEATTRPFRRARTKVVGMQAIADAQAAERAGKAAAKKYLEARSANYIAQARARERLIYGD